MKEESEKRRCVEADGKSGRVHAVSAGLPWQQAQNDSHESRCDKSTITLQGTGVCLSNESAPVYQTVCVNGVWVVVGG